LGKGAKQTNTRDIPLQTAEERGYQDRVGSFATGSMDTAQNLQNRGYGALGNTVNLDFGAMLGNYNNGMAGINQGYQNMANGILPTQFSTARQNALNTDLNSTVGSAVNNLANRGVINSSVANSAFDGITRNASDTLARNYTSDLGTYGNILGNQQQSMGNAMNTNILGQQASFYPAQQYMNMGSNAAEPLQNLFNTMYSGRMGTAGTTTTEKPGTMDTVATLASIGMMCFIAGTKVSTPDGDVNIEYIQLAQEVNAPGNAVETVTYVMEPCVSPDEYMTVEGEYGSVVTTTSTQEFLTDEGYVFVPDLVGKTCITEFGKELIVSVKPAEKELVYDLSTTGANMYFANGFAVKGCE
jgi:hypothetical protein